MKHTFSLLKAYRKKGIKKENSLRNHRCSSSAQNMMTASSDCPLGKKSLKSLELKLAYGRDMGYDWHMAK